ncbi:MAG TPA: hypothetical protein VFJ19_09735 [Nocardioidaceae bacterium]|nr:hypothetical protein [Nocardioidaceae bacterium]
MPKVLKATRAQVHAAQLIIRRAERGIGPEPSPAIYAIANAKPAGWDDDEQLDSDSRD